MHYTDRGKNNNTIIVSRLHGWRFDAPDRAGLYNRRMSWCDHCNTEDQITLHGACNQCYKFACRLSDDAPDSASDEYPGLRSDPGWTTFTKPAKMTKPFERSFTGKMMGSKFTNTTWVDYAKVTFQNEVTTGVNKEAFAGNCQDKAMPNEGLMFGLSCSDVGRYGFCELNGTVGKEFSMGYDVTEECLSRYLYIYLPYTVGYDGTVGGSRSLTLAEVEVYGQDGTVITPVSAPWGATIDGDKSTYYLAWSSGNDMVFEIDLGGLYDVRSVVITSRHGWPSSLKGASVTLSSGSKGTGNTCVSWDLTKSLNFYALGDLQTASSNGRGDMFNVCCECGGGEQVAEGWLRDYGREYGDHDSSIDFGWRCPVSEHRGVVPTARDYNDGWTAMWNWHTCPTPGIDNEWSIAVPYKGAYLMTILWQDVSGCSGGCGDLAAENVRLAGTSFAVADHVDGVSEMMVIEVYDGELTLSVNLTGRSKISWITIEQMADGGSEQINSDRIWMPTSDEAYHEVELEEKGAPVGLVVVELPGSNMMTSDYQVGWAAPGWHHNKDDHEAQKWFFDPPGDAIALSRAIFYGRFV